MPRPETRPRWLRFGSWPSKHDLDLVLEGGDADALTRVVPRRVRDPLAKGVALGDLLPPGLRADAIRAAGGLMLDMFLIAEPGGRSLECCAWGPSYELAICSWVPTPDQHFFSKAVPLRVPPPSPSFARLLLRQAGAAWLR